MVQRSELAAKQAGASVEILDLRTLCPWDKEAVLDVGPQDAPLSDRSRRHPLRRGSGPRSAPFWRTKPFFSLDAPIERITTPNVPIPYNVDLMNAVSAGGLSQVAAKIGEWSDV